MLSGDIAMLVGKERRLKIIDRKKNIFKLSQGEYIAPEKLENIYKLAHPSISTVYIYGNSLKNCIVGIINIEAAGLKIIADEFLISYNNIQEIAFNSSFKAKIMELLNARANLSKLNSLEKLKDIYIETRPFSELGLLTEAFKVK